ncbi:hypothetical protein ABT173_08595 [Streptomyces sp. NPDC001795]|uniref:hypothetical protein n=1 Tax=Streptomyces sp. NPDC001795 TaxID=3154525 RepID=UPI00332C5344
MVRVRGRGAAVVVVLAAVSGCKQETKGSAAPQRTAAAGTALAAVDSLTVKGRAPKTGDSRDRFGTPWADTDSNGCDIRVNSVLRGAIAGFSQRMSGVACCAV